MPTDTLLLYVLPDLAYVAKLIPGKKEHNFVLSDFRQINGNFLDDNILLEENLDKLLSKLDPGSYRLILPDFLFTSTIIDLEKGNEEEVKDYLRDKFLPSLGIDDENYYLDTTVLSNYKGTFKVQLMALEKALLNPLVKALKTKKDLKIRSISPLSWASKSIISLEPSVAILQLGSQLYLAEHYIGIDQSYYTGIDQAENFVETVKTLKGAESSLQTVYLLTDSLVGSQLKEKLKETLPVQQLTDFSSNDAKMPSHVKQIIEAGAKTFSIPEYLLPQFELDLNYDKELQLLKTEDSLEKSQGEEKASVADEKIVEKEKTQAKEDEQEDLENIVKPVVLGAAATALPKPQEISAIALNQKMGKSTSPEEGKSASVELSEIEESKKVEEIDKKVEKNQQKTPVLKEMPAASVKAVSAQSDVDLSKFANLAVDPSVIDPEKITKLSKERGKEAVLEKKEEVLKNKSEAGGIAKMIFIALASFLLTVALGAGLGFVYLQFTANQNNEMVEVLEPTPVEEVTPTPAPMPIINKEDYTLMVVNATGKAGYAGDVGKLIEKAGFPTVAAANAKGDYDTQDYLLVSEDDATASALLKELNEAAELDLQISTDIKQEDATGKYDAVIVLGK